MEGGRHNSVLIGASLYYSDVRSALENQYISFYIHLGTPLKKSALAKFKYKLDRWNISTSYTPPYIFNGSIAPTQSPDISVIIRYNRHKQRSNFLNIRRIYLTIKEHNLTNTCRRYANTINEISSQRANCFVCKLTTIGSDNGLSPWRHQAIIWSNAGIFLIGPLGINFIEILIEIQTFSFKKMHLKMSSAKWRPVCLGLNVLIHVHLKHSGYICRQQKLQVRFCK